MQDIIALHRTQTGYAPDTVKEIFQSVSPRRYFRLTLDQSTCIGTWSPDIRETRAFVAFTGHFRKHGINVPEILAVSEDEHCYLQTDLGDERLHEKLVHRKEPALDEELLQYYRKAIGQLVKMQVEGDRELDYSVCVPRPAFDTQAILWDLNHFKYYFLKLSGIPFDEQLLEEAFVMLAGRLQDIQPRGFMFRDFQSRNIMISDGGVSLIDYQGGRKGPLHYDLASLIFEAKAALTEADRETIIQYYFEELSRYMEVDREKFLSGLHETALVRILQALGAYGLRGIVEKKAVFLQSIPAGLRNLGAILKRVSDLAITSSFRDLLEKLAATAPGYRQVPEPFDGLTVTMYSFSYRNPLPDDLNGNGGGFVYDCRLLANPGKCEEMMHLNGFDPAVVRFLESDPEVVRFLEQTKNQLGIVIRKYQEIGYNNLMVSFGCTGGRHRSVYSAHQVAEWCRGLHGVRVIEIHRELDMEV